MMKIMEINSSCGFGSTGRNVLEIAEYLNSRGIDCCIAHTSGSHYRFEYIIGNTVLNKIHALLSRLIGWQEVYSILETRKLVRYITKNGFDIVNINNAHSNYISFPYLVSQLYNRNIHIVLTLHDCWFYTGKCTHYTKDNCFLWKKECGNCPRLKKDIASWFFDCTKAMLNQKRKLYLNSRDKLAVIGVSNWITNEARCSVLGCAHHISRIYNWVDLSIFRPLENQDSVKQELKIPQGHKILLGVAVGWTEDKGLFDFISLGETLPASYEIVLVGDIKEYPELPRNVHIVGRTKSIQELVRFYNVADCFLSLSVEESFGKVVAEALACGTPVIVYNSTASPELVGPNCGYVVEKQDFPRLLEAVMQVCEDGKEVYSTKCREFAIQNFEKNSNISQYLKVFQEIIGADLRREPPLHDRQESDVGK